MSRRVVIIGGGIAGLSAAIALRAKGMEAVVFECSPELQEAGAGLGINANAFQAMASLGLGAKLQAKGLQMQSATIVTDRGRPIIRTDSEETVSKYGTDNLTIHRAELLQVLADELPANVIMTGKTLIAAEQRGGRVQATFQDGSTAEGDVLVAADGIHSAVRRQLLPQAAPRYAGYTCWRSVVHYRFAEGSLPGFRVAWGTKGRFGMVPLQGDRVYWFACVKAPPRDPHFAAYGVAELQERYGGYFAPIPELLARTDPQALLWNDIMDLPPLNRYAFGSIVLIGDAAHATTPNLGQGAAQAMEDAVILAACLSREPAADEALRRFEQARLQRTRKVVLLSRRLGQLAQLETGWLCALRNAALRALPDRFFESRLKFLYKAELNPSGR